MYVSIDREALQILHVHTDLDICSGLLYLEGTKVQHAGVYNTTKPYFLADLTTLELNLLYLNSTASDFPHNFDDLARREAIAAMIEGMTPRKVLESELDAQINAVVDKLELPRSEALQFRYVPGAKRPAQDDGGLFPLTSQPLTAPQLAKAESVAPQARRARPLATEPATPPSAPSRPAAAPRTFTGSARPIIWAHADKVWDAAGKPTDPAMILELRKRMMVELEEQGIKKSTSSTALGDWMKDRLAKLSS
jgi:hypothetical protein